MSSRTMTGILLCLLWLWLPSASAQVPLSALDRSAPPAQGLLAWWYPLPGLTAGATSGWAVGTLPGTPWEVRFDGSDDFMVVPSGRFLYPPKFTLMAWVKL